VILPSVLERSPSRRIRTILPQGRSLGLIDRPLVAVHGLHHPLEHRIEELPRLLGVPVGQQLHRALEVGEEDRDLLALALERALRGEDLLREVLRSIRLGRRRSPGGRVYRLAALQTELRTGRQARAALNAHGRKPAPAFQAELRRWRVLVLAPGTMHAPTSPRRVPSD
jgi:hypothetical protein